MSEACSLPSCFTAGTTVRYRKSLSEYPAGDGWTFKLYLNGPVNLEVTASADGDAFTVTVTAVQSATLTAGLYHWTERVTMDGDVYDVDHGQVTVEANPATLATGAGQAWEEKAIAVIKARLDGRLTKDQEAFQIDGHSVTRIPIERLMTLLSQLEARLRQRRRGRAGSTILVRFPPVGGEQR